MSSFMHFGCVLIAFAGGVSGVASRVSPRRATHFTENQYQDTRSDKTFRMSGSPLLSVRWCNAPAAVPVPPVPQLPCRRAEERSGRRIKQDACLSEASLQPARLARAPQVARSAAEGHAYQGRLSLAYFSLATQRKVSRPPGRNPACHINQSLCREAASNKHPAFVRKAMTHA